MVLNSKATNTSSDFESLSRCRLHFHYPPLVGWLKCRWNENLKLKPRIIKLKYFTAIPPNRARSTGYSHPVTKNRSVMIRSLQFFCNQKRSSRTCGKNTRGAVTGQPWSYLHLNGYPWYKLFGGEYVCPRLQIYISYADYLLLLLLHLTTSNMAYHKRNNKKNSDLEKAICEYFKKIELMLNIAILCLVFFVASHYGAVIIHIVIINVIM